MIHGFVHDVLGVTLSRVSVRRLVMTLRERGRSYNRLRNLHNDPTIDATNVVPRDIRVRGCRNIGDIVSQLTRIITHCVDAAEAEIGSLMFSLCYDPHTGDCYKQSTRTVSFSGKAHTITFMSAPLLEDDYGFAATSTVRRPQTLAKVLFHEFSHYFSLTVEGRAYGKVRSIVRVLFKEGFSKEYLSGMERRWSNTEELRAIVGIFIEGRNVFYDYLNETEFNLVGGIANAVRISHSGLHFTRVPYRLLEFVEAGYGMRLRNVRASSEMYDGILDSI